jgi:hypothetical protein
MSITLSGDGSITGLTSTGISAVQNLPAGSVLQVVSASYNTEVSTTSTSAVDTGLSASITPKFSTSKILVIVSQGYLVPINNGNCIIATGIVRNSTSILLSTRSLANYSSNYSAGYVALNYLDSPATTSATTYKTQFYNNGNGGQTMLAQWAGSQPSVITLMEIAQ